MDLMNDPFGNYLA